MNPFTDPTNFFPFSFARVDQPDSTMKLVPPVSMLNSSSPSVSLS